MYDPPSKKNWTNIVRHVPNGKFKKEFRDAYDNGYNDAKSKKQYHNPYEYEHLDEKYTLNFLYYVGYYDENDKEPT